MFTRHGHCPLRTDRQRWRCVDTVYTRHGHCPLRTDRQTDRQREMERKGYDCDIPYATWKLYLKAGVGYARAMLSALRLQQQQQRQQRGRGRCHPLTTTASFACDAVCGKHVGPVALRGTQVRFPTLGQTFYVQKRTFVSFKCVGNSVSRNALLFPSSVSEILCAETHFCFLQMCKNFVFRKSSFFSFMCVGKLCAETQVHILQKCRNSLLFPLSVQENHT